jgi:hypothetical protein
MAETTTTTTKEEKTKEEKKPKSSKHDAVIVDLGRKSARNVRDLRKGHGPLMDDVENCLEELQESGALTATAQTVIVIVERRSPVSGMVPVVVPPGIPGVFPMGMLHNSVDDDDHDDDDDED